jgi:hypothetical protein
MWILSPLGLKSMSVLPFKWGHRQCPSLIFLHEGSGLIKSAGSECRQHNYHSKTSQCVVLAGFGLGALRLSGFF